MANVTSEMVKQLREKTGAGMLDCKNALVEANCDFDAAIEVLRKKGLKDIGKRAGKTAAEGTLGVYVHPGDQVVSVVELNCETDFVARNDAFKALAKDLAMHVAAMKPLFVSREEVPQSVLDKEIEILKAQLNEQQLAKADKIIPGKLEKYYEDNVLLDQIFVKDEAGNKTIKSLVEELGIKCGEKVLVRRFERIQVGEGIEKKQANLGAEVAAMVG